MAWADSNSGPFGHEYDTKTVQTPYLTKNDHQNETQKRYDQTSFDHQSSQKRNENIARKN